MVQNTKFLEIKISVHDKYKEIVIKKSASYNTFIIFYQRQSSMNVIPLYRDAVNNFLSKPFWWCTKQFALAVTPIREDHRLIDVSKLIGRFIGIITLATPAAACKLLAEICVLLTNLFHKNAWTYLKGDIEEINYNPKKLSILNWNICTLPGGLPLFFGGTDFAKSRIDQITSLLQKKSPDVICLQEVHDSSIAHKLVDQLKSNYAHFYVNVGSCAFKHNSGLFIASKLRITDPFFKAYNFPGKQMGINKGFFSCSLIGDEGKSIKLITTHLQPFKSQKDRQLRLREFKQVHNMSSSDRTIICGDFNASRKDNEIVVDMINQHYIDPLKDIAPDTFTEALGNHRWNRRAENNELLRSIDYFIYSKKNAENINIVTKVVKAFELSNIEAAISDHHALLTYINYP